MNELQWSEQPPTQKGLYWVSSHGYVPDELIYYFEDHGKFRSGNKGRDKVWDHWMGPIEKPAPPIGVFQGLDAAITTLKTEKIPGIQE